jgi:DNA invertase Pin-like site-specific DNA recombinase
MCADGLLSISDDVGEESREVESGKHNERPQLTAALAACKKHKAKLVIAKLDRLSRNLAFIAALICDITEHAQGWP